MEKISYNLKVEQDLRKELSAYMEKGFTLQSQTKEDLILVLLL
ncbi:6837_t:CDS:2 [Funneliformis mosseae]|uniref:6837_t:CDS:1 n=1 Tax=Funneliformis mosseae TaxID=27381 RepID=A0A9N9D423_FUNMO|nr:6837_t:CDS:2 [Funneliformis mosseae]